MTFSRFPTQTSWLPVSLKGKNLVRAQISSWSFRVGIFLLFMVVDLLQSPERGFLDVQLSLEQHRG